MHLCYVSPAAVTEFDRKIRCRGEIARDDIGYPSLGILTLAAVLEPRGVTQEVLNLSSFFPAVEPGEPLPTDFNPFDPIVGELRRREADVFGFGTLAGSYPLTLRLAREVSRIHPGAAIVLGGPQATAVDVPTLQAFPFAGVIVRGEAEETLPAVLDALHEPDRLTEIPGITFRRNGEIVRNPDRQELPDLDAIPEPAYHLWPGIDECPFIPIEVGRGCPYACTFCSTSRFFRRKYRLKSPLRVLAAMRRLRQLYGVTSFTLVHDAFTVDRARVLAFCQALEESGERFRWTCSARTDCVDDVLLDRMAAAGCSGVFFGIETGSDRVQRAINKCLDLEEARLAIRRANGLGMRARVSAIVGFPSETTEDLRQTVGFLADSLLLDRIEPQLHLLAPLAGTELHQTFRDRLTWDGVSSDIASMGLPQDPDAVALIGAHPDVFPDFYTVPTPHLDRGYVRRFRSFIACSTRRCRWLMVALHQRHGSLLDLFDLWQAWRMRCQSSVPDDDKYYASSAFRPDLLAFVASLCPEDRADPEALAVMTLLEYEQQLSLFAESSGAHPDCGLEPAPDQPDLSIDAVPFLAPGVALVKLSADYQGIIDCLRDGRSPRDVPHREVFVADRDSAEQGAEVVQLSPLAASLLLLCDGSRTVREIASLFTRLDPDLSGMPTEPACLFALNELAHQRLLAFRTEINSSPPPPTAFATSQPASPLPSPLARQSSDRCSPPDSASTG